jgi:aminopeptidase
MTVHERNLSASIDPVKLDRLAQVAIKVGLALRPGQDLLLTAPSAALPLVRKVAEHAYRAGAGLVTPILSDEAVTLARYRFAADDGFDRAAGWLYDGMAKAFAANTARLAIVGDNPMLLSGEDPARVARASKANSIAYQPALQKIVGFDVNWNIIAYPSASWAKQVFPGDLRRLARQQRQPRRGVADAQRRARPPHRMAQRPAVQRPALFRARHRPDGRARRGP